MSTESMGPTDASLNAARPTGPRAGLVRLLEGLGGTLYVIAGLVLLAGIIAVVNSGGSETIEVLGEVVEINGELDWTPLVFAVAGAFFYVAVGAVLQALGALVEDASHTRAALTKADGS